MKPGHRLWLTVIVLLVAMIVFAVGRTAGDTTASASLVQRLLWLAGELAGLVITAIVVGAVLKIFVMEGYFTGALAELFESDKWLDSISATRRVELWRNLTQKVYIPQLEAAGDSLAPDTDKNLFRARLSQSISHSFSYKGEEYFRGVDSELTVTWADPERSQIAVATEATLTIVPFDPSCDASWVTLRTPEPHLPLETYVRQLQTLLVDGVAPTSPPHVEMLGQTEKTTHVLKGKPQYRIDYKEKISWPLELDPTMTRTSIRVYDGFQLRVNNKADGLRILFLPVGGDELFENGGIQRIDSEDFIDFNEFSKRTAKRVVLPGQGYQLIFVRIKSPMSVPPGSAS